MKNMHAHQQYVNCIVDETIQTFIWKMIFEYNNKKNKQVRLH